MLAAHMDIENAQYRAAVQKFWRAPRMAQKPGLKAVDLFKAAHGGRIKALWIMATNPAVSMPDSNLIAAALQACPFVVVSDVTAKTGTANYAHVSLPAIGWGEKHGTVTNSERCISRQRAFLPVPDAARADWRIMCDVAKAMGFAGFDYASPGDIFAEHVALSQLGNDGARKFDLSAWVGKDYDTLQPTQWCGTRPFADGKFQTASGKAQFVPTPYTAVKPNQFVLNTGRIRDQWHTMTRTGLVPRLFGHRAEPYVELHPVDAAQLEIGKAGLVEIKTDSGFCIARALITDAQRQGEAFMPMHWSGIFASAARVNCAVAAVTDPISGQPALKSGDVRLLRFPAAWHGFGLSSEAHPLAVDYFARHPVQGGFAFECAGQALPENWLDLLRPPEGEVTAMKSKDGKSFRCVITRGGTLQFAFFASQNSVEANRTWLQSHLGQGANALAILAGRPVGEAVDDGAILCACNVVGVKKIRRFIAENPNALLDDVCLQTRAGTGCGSCRIEIRKMIHETSKPLSAAE